MPGGLTVGHDSLEVAGIAGGQLGIEVRAEALIAEAPLLQCVFETGSSDLELW
ncbi:MAG: hypothetical protein QOF53_1045 [Nocardioidaceae bacterium]|nr:hypothetical protein [Nocardioidaceae bacterium]